jgi:PKD repeat protein
MKNLQYLMRQYLLTGITLLLATVVIQFGCTPDNPAPASPTPNASFTYSSTRNFPVQVQFVNLSTSPFPGPSTFIWDFGDGSFISTSGNPVHMYVAAGTYMIKLVQTYAGGSKDTVAKVLQLNANGPGGISSGPVHISATDFAFTFPVAFTVSFTNTSTNASSYLWDFGDASNSTSGSPTVTHQYSGNGPFNVILKATGDGGTDTCSARIVF